ncbi:sensor histidine kinase [Kitasatospora sp. LaBMicrA B282]|uniref:sensor histidine kinase n=1 Tax=Kitasatospora sp. LaBMicrA B282 TaxID=3420949 RepID=UPI003D0D8185
MRIRRWRSLGKPKRMELYVRWSMYSMALAFPAAMAPMTVQQVTRQTSPATTELLLLLVLLSCVLAVPTIRRSLDCHLGRGPAPVRLLAAQALVFQAAIWLPLLLAPHRHGNPVALFTADLVLLDLWVIAPSVALAVRRLAPFGLAMLLLASAGIAVTSGSPGPAAVLMSSGLFGLATFAGSWRTSAWMVRTAYDLDDARETQARLAVAEERLRFSRDLHDVLGRNLTTIALKAELAVQLARRGRPEAADQMVEVQRLAQESQREVREVVRGYRTADLAAEVTGARSVLRAAGIECRIDLGPDPAGLPPLAQSVLGWVVREAATNVLRHSEAEQVSVRLWRQGGQAVLELVNDGVRATAPGDGGSGLAGLRERLTAQGGELSCRQDGDRYTLRATLPLNRPDAEKELAA